MSREWKSPLRDSRSRRPDLCSHGRRTPEQPPELSNTVSQSYDDDDEDNDARSETIGSGVDASSSYSSNEDAAPAKSIAYGWTKEQLIHFYTAMVEFMVRNPPSRNYVNQALKSRKAEFIDQSKKLGPLLTAKQHQLNIVRGQRFVRGQPKHPSLEDTVAFVLEEDDAEHVTNKREDAELLALLLTALTKLAWDDAQANPREDAKREFSLFILKAIMFYLSGAEGYKSFLNHEAFVSLATEDLKDRAAGLIESERAGNIRPFPFKLAAKKIILGALFGDNGMDALVQALDDEDTHSKEVLQKINSRKVPLIHEAVKDRIALRPALSSEQCVVQYWIRGPGHANSDASPHTNCNDAAASPASNNKNSSSPVISSPIIRQLLDPNLTFQEQGLLAEKLDEQNPGHGYLEAFTKPVLASLPAGTETTQLVVPSAETDQLAASAASANETETGETALLPGSSRHAPCTLASLLYDDTVRACVKKHQYQLEELDTTFADLPIILDQYKDGWRPVLETELDRAGAGRVWTLDDFIVYGWLGAGAFAVTFLVAPVESPGSLAVLRLEEHLHQDILMYFIRPTVCNAMVDEESVANVLAWFVVPQTKASKVLTATIMPFYSGGELTDRIGSISFEKDATKKVRMIVEIMQPLLAAMVGYERKGVVHRDIKPDNLLFDGDGSLKVCDHGLSREVSEDGSMTEQAGSPMWMAPEVALCQGMRMSNTMDMWSCGIIQYQLMSGEFPERNTDWTLAAAVFEHKALVELLAVTGGSELVGLCKRLLCFDPDDRITASPAKVAVDEIANDLPKDTNESG